MIKLLIISTLLLSALVFAQEEYKPPVNLLKCFNAEGYADIRYIPKSNLLDLTIGNFDLKEQNFTKNLTDDEIGMIQDGTWSVTFRDYRTSSLLIFNVSSNTNATYLNNRSTGGMECRKVGEIE